MSHTVSLAECDDLAALLDEVNRTGEDITVTKAGRPHARILPASAAAKATLAHASDYDLSEPMYSDRELDEFLDREMANIDGKPIADEPR